MARRRHRKGYRPNKPTEIPWVLIGGVAAVGVLLYFASKSSTTTAPPTVASAYVPNNVSAAKPLVMASTYSTASPAGGGGGSLDPAAILRSGYNPTAMADTLAAAQAQRWEIEQRAAEASQKLAAMIGKRF